MTKCLENHSFRFQPPHRTVHFRLPGRHTFSFHADASLRPSSLLGLGPSWYLPTRPQNFNLTQLQLHCRLIVVAWEESAVELLSSCCHLDAPWPVPFPAKVGIRGSLLHDKPFRIMHFEAKTGAATRISGCKPEESRPLLELAGRRSLQKRIY